MSRYSTFTCDTCKRSTDILTDNVRLQLTYCTITKGCSGTLSKSGSTDVATITPLVAGLPDWYPRGTQKSSTVQNNQQQMVALSCSANGALTIALRQTFGDLLNRQTVKVKLLQRKVEPIAFQQYTYQLESQTNEVFGRDINGKNLRVDQQSIDDGRVNVKVNGVERLDISCPVSNRIQFTTELHVGSLVSIVVAAEKNTIERYLSFGLHASQNSSENLGAWDNIRYVEDSTTLSSPNSWWVYTCTDLGEIANSTALQIDSVFDSNDQLIMSGTALENAMFLMASAPYENVDRYYNFCIPFSILSEEFKLSTPVSTVRQLQVAKDDISEIFPPLKLTLPVNNNFPDSSYINEDVISASSSSQIITDSTASRLTGNKTIGPI